MKKEYKYRKTIKDINITNNDFSIKVEDLYYA